MRVLILGASYGSVFGTKCLMAGHDVTLVCRAPNAKLINEHGTHVQIRLEGHDQHRDFWSNDLPGRLDAMTPETVDAGSYDLAVLAMQEPQYANHSIATLLAVLAEAEVPCLSLMNMPPLPFLKRIPAIDIGRVEGAYASPWVWQRFNPDLVSHCSPDPQAMRPPGQKANVLLVGLATNFKAAAFGSEKANVLLSELSESLDEVRVIGQEVPVKLRRHGSIFAPFAKWSMLMAGNYRCVTTDLAREVYEVTGEIVLRLGGTRDDLVPFDKYAKAALCLNKPSSVARAINEGAPVVERVDRLMQGLGRQVGIKHGEIDRIVDLVDHRIARNSARAA
jgi:hypothetical protein